MQHSNPVPKAACAVPEEDWSWLIILHSLFWLFVGNLVGLWLALILLFPSIGALTAPFSYGRLMTLHTNIQLYGWCSFPLIGLLMKLYLPRRAKFPLAGIALGIWSGALLVACLGWLQGETSGKLFMEWSGINRAVMALAMIALATILGAGLAARIAVGDESFRSASGRWVVFSKALVFLFLLAVPAVLFLAAEPSVYPPVNPDSGGATGGSLLGSSLGLVAVFWACPFILQLERKTAWRKFAPSLLILSVHMILYALLDHGNHSHHEPVQIAALCSLVIWIPLLRRHMGRFNWPMETRGWMWSFSAWAGILVVTALFLFMPGVLERAKFTNILVGHAHLAMAGMLTSFNFLILVTLTAQPAKALYGRQVMTLWNLGAAILLVSLNLAGYFESRHPDWLINSHPGMDTLYAFRFLGGVCMLGASAKWLGSVITTCRDEHPALGALT